jgi:GNAT superfamily N-acetyltransferase
MFARMARPVNRPDHLMPAVDETGSTRLTRQLASLLWMDIHQAAREEYEQVGDVVALAYEPYGSPDDEDWSRHLALVRNVADRAQRTVVLAAVEDGRVLGSATIELFGVIGDDDHEVVPDWAYLRMVGVHPEAQGRGIGRALVQDVIDRVRAEGKHHLGLRTTPPMHAAHRLYESLGFVRDASLDYPADSGYALLGYRLDLSD